MSFESIKRESKRYLILVAAIMLLQGIISSFISPYLGFFDFLGSAKNYLVTFLALLIILVPTEMILQRTV